MKVIVVLLIFFMGLGVVSATIPVDCDSSRAAYFKFDGSLNNSLVTSTDTSHAIIEISSGTPSYSSFKVDQGAIFSSVRAIIKDHPSSRPLDFSNLGDEFTIEFWFKENTASTSPMPLLSTNGYNISINNSRIYFRVTLSDGFTNVTSASYNVGESNFFAFTYSANTKKAIIYKNGNSVSSFDTSSGVLPNLQANINFLSSGLDVMIDELVFFRDDLSSTKINDHYTLSNNGKDYCAGSAANFSSTTSEFSLAGCSGLYLGKPLSVEKGTCSRDGFHFCDDFERLYYTLEDGRGCSLGLESYTPGSESCCPSGYICDPDTLTCELPNVECSSFEDEDDCSDKGCFWIQQDSTSGLCVSSPSEYSCGIYTSQSSCVQDTYNVGSVGFGTDICALDGDFFDLSFGQFVVSPSSCKCVWDVQDAQCKLSWELKESLYGSGLPRGYECWVEFNFGFCSEGEQEISWTSSIVSAYWPPNNIAPSEAINAAGCTDGQIVRVCGQPVINLPGWSKISLMLVILLLFIYYKRQER